MGQEIGWEGWSGRLYLGTDRLSGWIGLKSGGWVRQMGG